MYDIFFIGDKTVHKLEWKNFKEQLPILKSAENINEAKTKAITKFFWCIYPDIVIDDTFDFSYIPDAWSQDYVHVFLNDKTYDGISLIPKHAEITDRELSHRFYINKKEVDIVASKPTKYDIFDAESYDEYLHALSNSKTEMFWVIPSSVSVIEDFNFDLYFDHHNRFDRNINHMFLNGEYHDGIMLCSKNCKISQREWHFKFVAKKKEHDILASTPKPYDIVFISYQEPNADENYARLLERFPRAKRVHGVKGIHQAHIEGAKICNTDMVWIVDGDAEIDNDFNFEYQVPRWQHDHVHVWRSKNPINGLVYGYGGVKLFPRQLTIDMDTSKPDMTTSISGKFKAIKHISNVTAFNTDPFNTWKSAFRECCKLASKVIDRQKDDETDRRLKIWTSVGKNKPYGKYALMGARAGMAYGLANKDNIDALKKINNFDWLKDWFNGNI